MFGSAQIAKIFSRDKYYYLTRDNLEKGWFKLYSESLSATDYSIKNMPGSGAFKIIPREIIDNFQPNKCILMTIQIKIENATHTFKDIPLGDLVNKTTLSDPDALTMALMSAGQICIKMTDDKYSDMLMLSEGIVLPKTACPDVIDQLNKCINKLIYGFNNEISPSFKIVNDPVTVVVSVDFRKEFKEELFKAVGHVKLPDPVPEQVPEPVPDVE